MRSSRRGTSVETIEGGHYVVTFLRDIQARGVTAIVNNSQGDFTAVPGDNTDLESNQVFLRPILPGLDLKPEISQS